MRFYNCPNITPSRVGLCHYSTTSCLLPQQRSQIPFNPYRSHRNVSYPSPIRIHRILLQWFQGVVGGFWNQLPGLTRAWSAAARWCIAPSVAVCWARHSSAAPRDGTFAWVSALNPPYDTRLISRVSSDLLPVICWYWSLRSISSVQGHVDSSPYRSLVSSP